MKINFKISKYYIPALVVLMITTGSCKKSFLDREAYAALPTEESITTLEDMETALNGVYAEIRDPKLFGRSIPLIGDILADNAYISVDENRTAILNS